MSPQTTEPTGPAHGAVPTKGQSQVTVSPTNLRDDATQGTTGATGGTNNTKTPVKDEDTTGSDTKTGVDDDDDTSGTVKPPVVPVKAADSMDALVDELQKAVSDPADVIKAGFAPVPYCFGFQPSSKHADQVQAFSGLLGMSAITRMFASINLITGRQAKKITAVPSLKDPEEYVDGFNEQAEAAIKSVTAGPLTQIYNSSENNITRTEEQQLKRSDIHNFVLPRIFGGVPGITKAHMTQLDTVLTDLVTALKPLTVTPTDTQPVIKQVIFINYVNATDITGTGDVFVIEPICRMVTLTLQSDEWTNALLKPGFLKKNEKINFGMTTTTMNMKMDATKWAASKSRYEQVVKTAVSDEPALKKILDNGGIEGFGRATCMVLSLDPVKPSDD